MASKLELLLEAERRGILPPDKQNLLDEARSRGLIEPKATEQETTEAKYDAQIAREREMTSEEYEAYQKDRIKQGKFPRAQPGRFGGLTNQIADPLKAGDEISGAGAFLADYVPNLLKKDFWAGRTSGEMERAGAAYTDAAESVRAEQRLARKQNTIIPEIVGGFVTGRPAAGFKMAPTFGGRVLQSAKAGGVMGAVAGFTGSGGGVGERLEGTAAGAATGAVLGPVVSEVVAPAIGGIVRGAKATGRGLGQAVSYLRGRNANRDARLNRALEAQNTPPSVALQMLDEAEAAGKFGKTQLDTKFTLADTGPVARDLADTAALVSPEARKISGEFLNERARGQYGRVNDYLRRAMRVVRGDFAKTQAKIIEEQQQLSKTAYDEFRAHDTRIDVGDILYDAQIDDLAAAPALKKTLQEARDQFVAATEKRDLSAPARRSNLQQASQTRDALRTAQDELRGLRRQRQDAKSGRDRETLLSQIRAQEDHVTSLSRDLQAIREGKPARVMSNQAYTQLTPARFDAGKRALDDMIESAQRGGRGNEARLLVQIKNKLVKAADDATTVPVLDKAGKPVLDAQGNPQTRSLYAEARDVYGSRAEMLDALDAGRTFMRGDSEMTGAQYKALSTAEKRMFRIGVVREVRKVLGGKGLNSDALGYFDRPNTRDVLAEIMTPGQAKKFYQLVEVEQAMAATNTAVRGNSATARRQQNVLDFSLATRLGRAIKDQGLRQALANEIYDGITKVFAMRDADAVALTKAMFETDMAAQRATLTRLTQTYGTPRTQAVLNRAQKIARAKLAATRRSLAGITGEISGQMKAEGQPSGAPQLQRYP